MEKPYLPSTGGALSPEELSAAKSNSQAWLGVCGLVLFVHAICIFINLGGGNLHGFDFLIGIVFVICCSRYAVSKGYHWAMGFWGIVSFLGLALLVSKPLKARSS